MSEPVKKTSNELAEQRTSLSNQRTFLAYIRTGLAVSAFGVKLENKWMSVIGLVFIAIGFFQYQGLKLPSESKDKYLNLTSLTVELTIIAIIFLLWYNL